MWGLGAGVKVFQFIIGNIFSLSNIRKWVGWLVANWKQVLAAAIIGLFLYQALSPVQFLFGLETVPAQKAKVEKLKAELALKEQELATAMAANEGLANAIKEQNDKLTGWSDLSKKLDQSTEALVTEIRQSRRETNNKVDKILKGKTPQTCQEALQYLRDSIVSGELRWDGSK